jgi:diguanylate cyclase (GGDEF)-like protein
LKVILDDVIEQDFSDKKIILFEESQAFRKAIAAKIYKNLGCSVETTADLEYFKKAIDKNDAFFVSIIDYESSGCGNDAMEYALSKRVPVIVMASDFDDDLRDQLLSKEIVDYVLKRSIEDTNYIVNLIRQLARNSETEVLIVEDSSVYRKSITSMLQNQLFKTYEAKDGEEALELMAKHPDIKLVLTDYFMPRMDGFELVTRLRKIKSKDELSIIAVSGDASKMVISKFLKSGANDYIKKPFSKEEFVCRVNNNVEYLYLIAFQKELINFDFLTGLHNKKYLLGVGQTLHANATRGNIDFIVGMMDIDNFKLINDRYGHDIGDLVIKDFARCLNECFRKSDIICRFGGEEFCVLLTNVKKQYIEHTFERLIHTVRASQIVTNEKEIVSYSVSIGVCTTLMDSFEAMLKRADEKLYEAKRAGKDRVITDLIAS